MRAAAARGAAARGAAGSAAEAAEPAKEAEAEQAAAEEEMIRARRSRVSAERKGKEEGVAPPQGSHDWSAVVRVASLRARQVCKAKDMPSCGNSEKRHQQSRTTQGLLDFDFAGALHARAEEDDEQYSFVKCQGGPW